MSCQLLVEVLRIFRVTKTARLIVHVLLSGEPTSPE